MIDYTTTTTTTTTNNNNNKNNVYLKKAPLLAGAIQNINEEHLLIWCFGNCFQDNLNQILSIPLR